jgi:iron(III) transport system substrate-binding protein
MKKISFLVFTSALLLSFASCAKKEAKQTVWIYTSLYKDTVTDLKAKMEKDFPGVEIQFYQAGSEEVAAKVQAESLAGGIQADILISSDRFWYEDMGAEGKLVSYKPAQSEKVPEAFKNPNGFYTTLSYPVMVISYNSESVSDAEAPKSFKELTDPKWKDKVSVGSPLASGTSFTTVAFLAEKYGWEYFSALRKNNLISEGGNSGVIRRLQSKERPVGIVLLENILRLTKSDPRIKYLIPTDGAVLQSNVLALVKKEGDQALVKKIADWMFASIGQEAMLSSFMYSGVTGYPHPEGAPDFDKLQKDFVWSQEFISKTMKAREQIKDQFSKIMF